MRANKISLAVLGCVLGVLFSVTVRADVVTIRFDELPDATPVNNVNLLGVRFGFTLNGLASTDARFRQVGPRNQTYVQCPCLEGNAAGILTLDFESPTSILSFGIARVTNVNVLPGATIQIFDAMSVLLNTYTVDVVRTPSFNFPEGIFSYAGAPVSRAVITFNNPAAGLRFAVDNLTFDQPATAVPEPATWLLLSTGLTGVAALRRRRNRRNNEALER